MTGWGASSVVVKTRHRGSPSLHCAETEKLQSGGQTTEATSFLQMKTFKLLSCCASTALLVGALAHADVVTDWNTAALDATDRLAHVRDLEYTFDFNEIKAFGSLNSTARTADQTNLAIFWYESSPNGWSRIARLLVAQQSHSLAEHARLFATLEVALADAYIASFDSKYFYNFWRPFTAIRRAGTDGNDLTVPDLEWEPLLLTPPVPDYPSAHAAAGGAASAVLISFFGGDEHTFTLASTFPVPPRTFNRISDAAKENAISRMLVGIHFRLACTGGYEQGLAVGQWAVQHGR